MRKRIHKVANFLAFNLLFFALYLNFIYKDPSAAPLLEKSQHPASSAFGESLLDESMQKKETPAIKEHLKAIASPKAAY